MKIILNKTYDGLGNEGDIVNVKNGYARNFLIPNNLALVANDKNMKCWGSYKFRFLTKMTF